jgi:hypothetical protein
LFEVGEVHGDDQGGHQAGVVGQVGGGEQSSPGLFE